MKKRGAIDGKATRIQQFGVRCNGFVCSGRCQEAAEWTITTEELLGVESTEERKR